MAKIIVGIHGLANKPALEHLRRIWLDSLAVAVEDDEGFSLADVGVTASFVYWADLFNDEPIPSSEYESVDGDIETTLPNTTTKSLNGLSPKAFMLSSIFSSGIPAPVSGPSGENGSAWQSWRDVRLITAFSCSAPGKVCWIPVRGSCCLGSANCFAGRNVRSSLRCQPQHSAR